jgi:hypothetical protein
VIEAELQAVLNTLIEQNSQHPLKNGRSSGNSAYAWKGDTSRVVVASRLKVSFDQIAAPVPENMDGCLYKPVATKQTFPWI